MAPRGAPSPGRRRPPISPALSPAGPARLRRGALLGGVQEASGGPSVPLLVWVSTGRCAGWVGGGDGGETRFSLRPAEPAGAELRQDPSLPGRVRASEPRASTLLPVSSWFGFRLPPPPAPAELSRRRPRLLLRGSLREWALSRGAQTWRPIQRSAGRAGPAWQTRSRGEAGGGEGRSGEGKEGAVSGWAPSRLRCCTTPVLHLPSPPLPWSASPRLNAGVARRDHSLSGWSAAPPRTLFDWGSSHPNSPGFFPVSIARDRRSFLS